MKGQPVKRRWATMSIDGKRGAIHGWAEGDVVVRATAGDSVCLEIVDERGVTATLYMAPTEADRVAILTRKAVRELQVLRRARG